MNNGFWDIDIPQYKCRRGKVKNIYEINDYELIIVTTDRISAYDYVFPNTTVPDRGKILHYFSLHWANVLNVNYHLMTDDVQAMPIEFRKHELVGRTMLVEKVKVIPFECVVRGYLAGSAWKEYKKKGEICGLKLPKGLKQNQALPMPMFTPATKVETGHDENITFDYMSNKIGFSLAVEMETTSIELYTEATKHVWYNGTLIADTKFEFGLSKRNELLLIDEVLTPDSSRFWPVEEYKLGKSINSFDKQCLRDWCDESDWDKNSVPDALPQDIIATIGDKYKEAFQKIICREWQGETHVSL